MEYDEPVVVQISFHCLNQSTKQHMSYAKVKLNKEQIEYLMDLIDTKKSKYKTQEEWWNSKEFVLIEILDEARLTINI